MQYGEVAVVALTLLACGALYGAVLRPPPSSLFEIEGLPIGKLQEIWHQRHGRGVALGLGPVGVGLVLLVLGLAAPEYGLPGLAGTTHVALGLLLVLLGLLVARDQWRCPLCHGCLWTATHGQAPLTQGFCPHCDTHFGDRDTEARPHH